MGPHLGTWDHTVLPALPNTSEPLQISKYATVRNTLIIEYFNHVSWQVTGNASGL